MTPGSAPFLTNQVSFAHHYQKSPHGREIALTHSVNPPPIKNLPSPCGRGTRGGGIVCLLAIFLILPLFPLLAIASTNHLLKIGQTACYDTAGKAAKRFPSHQTNSGGKER